MTAPVLQRSEATTTGPRGRAARRADARAGRRRRAGRALAAALVVPPLLVGAAGVAEARTWTPDPNNPGWVVQLTDGSPDDAARPAQAQAPSWQSWWWRGPWSHRHHGGARPTQAPAPTTTSAPATSAPATPAPATTTDAPAPAPTTQDPQPAPSTTDGTQAATSAPASTDISALEQQAVDLMNQVRSQHGCQPLTVDAGLQATARAHSAAMVAAHVFDHSGRSGLPATPGSPAENIMEGFQNDAQGLVLDGTYGWVGSEEATNGGHYRNIVNCAATRVGLGYVDGQVEQGMATGAWTAQFS